MSRLFSFQLKQIQLVNVWQVASLSWKRKDSKVFPDRVWVKFHYGNLFSKSVSSIWNRLSVFLGKVLSVWQDIGSLMQYLLNTLLSEMMSRRCQSILKNIFRRIPECKITCLDLITRLPYEELRSQFDKYEVPDHSHNISHPVF